MLALEFLNARHGDCSLVRWGDPERVMLVDGGPTGVYETTLRERLITLPAPPSAESPTLDVVCVTHVDDDHIVGVVRLLTELHRARTDQLPAPFHVARLWHNSVELLLDVHAPGLSASTATLVDQARAEQVVAASYQQGADVRRLAKSLGLALNAPFNAPLVCGASTNCDGLQVTVVGPDQTALAMMAEKWSRAMHLDDAGVIAAAFADRSVPNLSSIAIHLQYGGRTALLTGDARGDRLVAGLEATGLAGPDSVLELDVLKLPHHGSASNAAPSLFQRVRADRYVISADGVRHHHPDEATLRWLVESRDPGDDYVIHLTNQIPFALDELNRLRQNRRFRIDIRSPGSKSVVLDFAD